MVTQSKHQIPSCTVTDERKLCDKMSKSLWTVKDLCCYAVLVGIPVTIFMEQRYE